MKPVKKSDLEKELEKLGYTPQRQRGSHATYKNDTGNSVTITGGREIPPGTLRSIIKQEPKLKDKYGK